MENYRVPGEESSEERDVHVSVSAGCLAFFSKLRLRRFEPRIPLNSLLQGRGLASSKAYRGNLLLSCTGADQTGGGIHRLVQGYHGDRPQTAPRDPRRHGLLRRSGTFLSPDTWLLRARTKLVSKQRAKSSCRSEGQMYCAVSRKMWFMFLAFLFLEMPSWFSSTKEETR